MKDEKKEKEELLAMVPELPEGFIEWCENQMERAPVFYKRKGNYTDCKCGMCGKEYRLYTPTNQEYGTEYREIPKRNDKTVCVKCKGETYYEWERIKGVSNEERWYFLYQLLQDGSVLVRIFECWSRKQQGTAQRIKTEEVERIFLIKGQVKKMSYRYYCYTGKSAWVMENGKGYPGITMRDITVYPGWREVLEESELRYCPVDDIAETVFGRDFCNSIILRRVNVLMAYVNNPALEMYHKMKMTKLVKMLVWREGILGSVNRRKTTVEGQLRLKNRQNIKRLKEAKGDTEWLEILQYVEKNSCKWNTEQEGWIKYNWGLDHGKMLDVFLKYMTVQKLMNRVKKYREQTNFYSDRYVLREYRDYLKMREELGYDMKNEVFLYPRNLHEKHQEMVEEVNKIKDEKLIVEKKKEFFRIEKRYSSLCRKYQAVTAGYLIRPAKDAGEIIMEGRTLHHCVGRDMYLKKHNDGKSTILFLRKVGKPEEPYITIEIAGTKINQWYGINNTKPDKEIIDRLLEDYVKQLERKLKKENKNRNKKQSREELDAAG